MNNHYFGIISGTFATSLGAAGEFINYCSTILVPLIIFTFQTIFLKGLESERLFMPHSRIGYSKRMDGAERL